MCDLLHTDSALHLIAISTQAAARRCPERHTLQRTRTPVRIAVRATLSATAGEQGDEWIDVAGIDAAVAVDIAVLPWAAREGELPGLRVTQD